ncbi:MAG: sigma-70 family RNA polymerase sigma factor [Armatimonadetes bacterium]|nr:sigma-70 family RNA polymerase sigma factor [Armatimonadota bacterium]
METLSDLVRRTLAGDTEAFGEVVDRYQDMAFACAYAVLRDRQDAEDAVQDAFITAFTRLGELREPARFPGWLRRIVLTACGRITRRPRLPRAPMEAADEVPSPEGDPAAIAERAERRAELMKALDALPPPCRMATMLFYINGYSVREVAEFQEVPVGTVKYRLHEARKRLRERMVDEMRDDLSAARPGPALRQAILDTLLARKARFDEHVAAFLATHVTTATEGEWAAAWHERRLRDVRANAAQYGITPDETLPRMLPGYRLSETFRDDFTDVPRRWGIPPGVKVIVLRDFARKLGVRPLALYRWEAEGLPVLRYDPWWAFDEERAEAWVRQRGTQPQERMTPEEGREMLLLALRTLAAGDATEAEVLPTFEGLSHGSGGLDPLWWPTWRARLPAEREENARQYGLAAPTPHPFGIPQEVHVFEIRDFCRRLGISPFDVIRWTRDGMPAVRSSPHIRWDPERVAQWLADRGLMPGREYSRQELDVLEAFVIGAVARGEGSPEDARDILTSWRGVM